MGEEGVQSFLIRELVTLLFVTIFSSTSCLLRATTAQLKENLRSSKRFKFCCP